VCYNLSHSISPLFLIKKKKSLEPEKLFHLCEKNYSREFAIITWEHSFVGILGRGW
jgi:hypothetical protein